MTYTSRNVTIIIAALVAFFISVMKEPRASSVELDKLLAKHRKLRDSISEEQAASAAGHAYHSASETRG